MDLSEFKDINSLLKTSAKEYNQKELELGIKVEKEHAATYAWIKRYYEENGKFPDEKDVYEHIAKEHLDEYEDYYTRLKRVET